MLSPLFQVHLVAQRARYVSYRGGAEIIPPAHTAVTTSFGRRIHMMREAAMKNTDSLNIWFEELNYDSNELSNSVAHYRPSRMASMYRRGSSH